MNEAATPMTNKMLSIECVQNGWAVRVNAQVGHEWLDQRLVFTDADEMHKFISENL